MILAHGTTLIDLTILQTGISSLESDQLKTIITNKNVISKINPNPYKTM